MRASRMSALGCGFNQLTQHIEQTVLPALEAERFPRPLV